MRVEMTEAYREWINGLKDVVGRARVQVRVDRLAHGNPGRQRVLGGGVCELKIDFGPGYRVYLHRTSRCADCAAGWWRQVHTDERHQGRH